MTKRIKKGFTIVELVIVIAVIGVLAAILIPTFISLNKKAEEKADNALVRNINNALRIEEAQEGKNPNLHEAVLDLDEYGYKLANLVSKSGQKLLWDQDEDQFILDNGGHNGINFWEIRSSMPGEGNKRSIYAGNNWNEPAVGGEEGIDYGFDVGYNTNVASIKYKTTGNDQNVVIRTNSAATSLTVDAPNASIQHYDSLGALNIISAKTSSYHENGKVVYAEISYGRIVLEKGSDVEEIHVNKKTDSSFDTVIISNNGGEQELPERITRDAVTVTEETLVVKVESAGSSEDVFVYADSGSGTKGSTQKVVDSEDPSHNQNANVNSALGQLVLDNGSAGDKAQTVEEKEAAKQEAVEEAVIEEIEESDKYVARIGTTPFESLKDAVAAASTNAVIEMTANDPSTANLTVNKQVTINMNEKTFGGTFVVATSNNIPVTINGTANVDAVLNNDNKYYSNLYVGASGSYHLLKDYTMTGTTITYGRNYVLDLGGHTLTMTYGGSDGAFEVKKDIYDGVGKLTIRNGNLNFTSTSSSANAFEVYGELTLDSVNVNSSCGNAAIKGEGGTYSQNCAITITNSIINSAGHGVYLMSYKSWSGSYISTLSISGSTINASNIGLYANGASCTVENTTIESSGSHAIQTISSNPATGIPANVVISGTTTLTAQSANTIDCKSGTMQISGNVSVSGTNRCIYVQNSSLTIAGGTYNGNFGLGASGQLTIAGGTYNGNLIDVTQAGRLLVIGETQFEELVTYSITGSNGSYDVQVAA